MADKVAGGDNNPAEVILNLRGFSRDVLKTAIGVNSKIYDVCYDMLRTERFFICEEVTLRSGQARSRQLIRWNAIRDTLAQTFDRPLLAVSRQGFRDLTNPRYDDHMEVPKTLREKLLKGHGRETAGYGFPDWRIEITDRAINHRRHAASSFTDSAERIEAAKTRPALLEAMLADDDKEET